MNYLYKADTKILSTENCSCLNGQYSEHGTNWEVLIELQVPRTMQVVETPVGVNLK